MKLHWVPTSPAVIVLSQSCSCKQALSNCSSPRALSRAQALETFGSFGKVKNEAGSAARALVSSDGKRDVGARKERTSSVVCCYMFKNALGVLSLKCKILSATFWLA